MQNKLIATAILSGVSTLLLAASASAQMYGGQAEGQAGMGMQPSGQAGMGLPAAQPPAAVAQGDSDHDAMVGRLAVGYLGRSTVSIAAPNPVVLTAPVVGVRYWIDQTIGIDAGLGILATGGSTESAGVSVDDPGVFGMILHAGVPLSLASEKHYSFQIVPEANIGFGSSTVQIPATPGAEDEHSGFHLDLGARAGAEVHFGFINIPQLSLQGSVGVQLAVDSRSTTQRRPGVAEVSLDRNTTVFQTTVGNSPWEIFTGGVSAFYYF